MTGRETSPGVRAEHQRETALNITVSRVLTIGLISAVVLLVAGVILTLARPGLTADHQTSVTDLPRALAGLKPGGFFTLGLLVLLATPAARVVALLFAYARRRRWMFACISLFVLAVLVLSGFLGLRAG